MNIRANSGTRQTTRDRAADYWIAYGTLMVIALTITPVVAAPEDEVRAAFDRFVAAQNAHDVKAVESLLLDSPNFLWITRGTPVWGAGAAVNRFAALYQGTWRLRP